MSNCNLPWKVHRPQTQHLDFEQCKALRGYSSSLEEVLITLLAPYPHTSADLAVSNQNMSNNHNNRNSGGRKTITGSFSIQTSIHSCHWTAEVRRPPSVPWAVQHSHGHAGVFCLPAFQESVPPVPRYPALAMVPDWEFSTQHSGFQMKKQFWDKIKSQGLGSELDGPHACSARRWQSSIPTHSWAWPVPKPRKNKINERGKPRVSPGNSESAAINQ